MVMWCIPVWQVPSRKPFINLWIRRDDVRFTEAALLILRFKYWSGKLISSPISCSSYWSDYQVLPGKINGNPGHTCCVSWGSAFSPTTTSMTIETDET